MFRIALDRKPAFLDYKNIKMFGYVRPCTAMHGYARLCTAMHGYVSHVRSCTAMYGYVQPRKGYIGLCTTIYNNAQLCTAMHDYARLCTSMYGYARLWTRLRTAMNGHVRLCSARLILPLPVTCNIFYLWLLAWTSFYTGKINQSHHDKSVSIIMPIFLKCTNRERNISI